MVPFLLSLWSFPPVAPLLGLVGVTCSYDAHRAAATRVHQKQQTACGRCAKHRPAPLSRRVICGHATSVWIVVGLLGFVRRDCMQRNMVEVPLIPVKLDHGRRPRSSYAAYHILYVQGASHVHTRKGR